MREKLAVALREAAKAGERTRVAILRLVLAALADRLSAQRSEVVDPRAEEAALREILEIMLRQRLGQIRAYEEAGRLELAAAEEAEVAILREFLPRRLSDAEVETAVARAIADTGATGLRDLSAVVALLRARHGDRMDFRGIAKRVAMRLRVPSPPETPVG